MSRVPRIAHLVLAWLPIWGLYALMLGPGNPIHSEGSSGAAAANAFRSILAAALLGILVKRLADRVHWPLPFTFSFAFIHLAAAALYAVSWFAIAASVENTLRPGAIHGYFAMIVPNMVLGVWLYVMIAGMAYATQATERAARAEAATVRARLTALRAQLNPHFLFNALHTVVHLIPERPEAASQAAQRLAELLRVTVEEDRDVVSLADEIRFIEKYLDVERLRFADRLVVHVDVSDEARNAELPSFALQTLVENAVRHGVGPRAEPTTITILGRLAHDRLTLTVTDTGAGKAESNGRYVDAENGKGTGLRRLRDRLDALYGDAGRLDLTTAPDAFNATLSIPAEPE